MVVLGCADGLIAGSSAVLVVAVIALSLPVVFFACQPVQIVVAVAAVQYDIRQNGILIALYLFALQPAVAVVFELGVQASLSA
ncbi:hypothetical protein DKK71_00735 [Snodgrassella alvi]|nr:hypothetical protein DKK71_00735 [Snodgrassella alvi]